MGKELSADTKDVLVAHYIAERSIWKGGAKLFTEPFAIVYNRK